MLLCILARFRRYQYVLCYHRAFETSKAFLERGYKTGLGFTNYDTRLFLIAQGITTGDNTGTAVGHVETNAVCYCSRLSRAWMGVARRCHGIIGGYKCFG